MHGAHGFVPAVTLFVLRRRRVGTISAHMRDDSRDTVTPGGQPTPLGARGDAEAEAGRAVGETAPSLARLALSTRLLLLVLGAALLVYAAVAADVVNAGRLSEQDVDVATWVAGSMPSWAEWLARPFTWLGGAVGATIVVTGATTWLFSRRARVEAALLVVVAVGVQILVFTAKDGYARPRPDLGSAVRLPSSFSFPSGHAATGIAVFGLLGLLAATFTRTRAHRVAAVGAGFTLGALIGASRVVLGVHYLTDVLAGAFLGLAWLSVCLLVVLRLRR
ncbi:MAG TPA: phosphatase PAP2 family protein [Gaiella sp.]